MSCIACPRLCASRSGIVYPTPPRLPRSLLCIGEAPGKAEDEAGAGFVGAAGKTLRRELERAGLDLSYQVGFANVVRCRPPNNDKPTRAEIDSCLPHLAETLERLAPKVLLLVGTTAADTFLGKRSLSEHINASRSSAPTEPSDALPTLRLSLQRLMEHHRQGGHQFSLIPMPHTSGLAWNRPSPWGKRWSEIGREQIELATSRLLS